MIDHAAVFVTTEWLASHLEAADVAIVDASWYLPTAGRDAFAEYQAAHIPGAVFFDIDKIADPSSGLPHMLPSAEIFGETVGKLGISDTQTIVVYDGAGLFSAARVWWTFRVMGGRDVRILDGGLPQWTAEGRPTEQGITAHSPGHFAARFDAGSVRDLGEVRDLVDAGGGQIVDARPAARFRGEAPEPRAGLRAGHIPGSRNVPFDQVVANGHLKGAEELRAVFAAAGIDPSKPVVASCGSGVSAAILTLALTTLGSENVAIYDGSWADWGSHADAPIETGPAR